MKNVFISAIIWLFAVSPALHASLIWSEDFSSYAPGASVNGQSTSIGNGTFETVGTVSVNAAGGLDLTAGTGRVQLGITSPAAVKVGKFSFDLISNTNTDRAFLQMVQGTARSTGGTPQPNFSDDTFAYSLATSQAISYFFNVSGAATTYMAPDSMTRTLANNTYDLWVGTSSTLGETNSNNGAGPPTLGVGSVFFQTFGAQNGDVLSFDNFKLESIAVPEPSNALTIAVLFGAMALFLRGRRTLASA